MDVSPGLSLDLSTSDIYLRRLAISVVAATRRRLCPDLWSNSIGAASIRKSGLEAAGQWRLGVGTQGNVEEVLGYSC